MDVMELEKVEYRLPDSATMKDRIKRLLDVAAEFAKDTDTDADDKAVAAVQNVILGSPFVWEIGYRLLARRLPAEPRGVAWEVDVDETITELQAKRDGRAEAIDPATIILAIQAIIPLLQGVWGFLKKRRESKVTPVPVPVEPVDPVTPAVV